MYKNFGDNAEIEHSPHKVDGNRIQSDNNEGESPFTVSADIDNPVKEGKDKEA